MAKSMLLRQETFKDNPYLLFFDLDYEDTLTHNSLIVSEDGPASELSSRIPNTTTTRSLCAITDF
jgi:hypothetical protein